MIKQSNEEPLKKERPKSAIMSKYTDKYTNLDFKHKNIKATLQKSTNSKRIGIGGNNNFYKINDKIGIREEQDKNLTKNTTFNQIFVSSLLEICGEKTIDSGQEKDKNYFELAKNDLYKETEQIFKKRDKDSFKDLPNIKKALESCLNKIEPFDDLSPKELLILDVAIISEMFNTCNFWVDYTRILQSDDVNHKMEGDLLSFTLRVLCKIFLLQMYDRKTANLVVVKDTEGNIDFREIDFDDNKNKSIVFGRFNGEKHNNISLQEYWNRRLTLFLSKYKKLNEKYFIIEESIPKMLKNYTMTSTKIEELIKKTALKAKYMGLSEQEVIDGINKKIELWKEMLNDEENGEIVNQIDGIEQARKQTLTALNQIRQKDVERIVNDVMMFHDFTYDNPHFKDDNDVVKDVKMKDVKLSNEEVNEQLAMRRKDNIKKFQEEKKQQDQAQHINKFVKDNGEITIDDINAENLISYFKQEKDRSRRFFWMFGQRNKRFNALCEALEVVGIQNPEQLFRRNANAEDEKQIRDLFGEQQQGNNANQEIQNNRPQLKTEQVKQKIVNRLNQVGCCSCG